jgi:hypothetical protein
MRCSEISWKAPVKAYALLVKGTNSAAISFFLSFFFFLPVLGLELRAYTLSHPPDLYCDGFFFLR